MTDIPLRALVLVCTLKPSPSDSSSQLLGSQVMDQLGKLGVTGESSASSTRASGLASPPTRATATAGHGSARSCSAATYPGDCDADLDGPARIGVQDGAGAA